MKSFILFWDFVKLAHQEIFFAKKFYLKAFLALIFLTNLESLYSILGISTESTSYIIFSILSVLLVFIVLSQIVLFEKKKRGGSGELTYFVPTFLLYNLYYSFLFLLGLVLLIGPGVYVFIYFSLVPLIAVLDDDNHGNFFKQSRELVNKNVKLVSLAVFLNLFLECSALVFSPIQHPTTKAVLTLLFSLPEAYFTILMTIVMVKIYYYLKSL